MKICNELKLGEIVKITGGGTPSRIITDYWGGNIPWVTVKDFVSKKIATAQEKITPKGLKNSASNLIPAKSILMPTRMALGKIAINEIPVAINQDIKALEIIDKQKANPKFIAYSFHSSPYIKNQLASKNRGAIMNGRNLGLIKETKLRKPPIELQNHFAGIIGKAESLNSRYTQSLTELESLYGSLSQRAFKGELDLSNVKVEAKN